MYVLLRIIGTGIAVGLVALGPTACGAARDEGVKPNSDRGKRELSSSQAQVDPGPNEQALLELVAQGISAEVTVRFADVPADFLDARQTMKLPPDGTWLEVDIPIAPTAEREAAGPDDTVRQARLRWEGRLIVGAYRDAAASQGLRQVVGASFLASGVLVDRGLIPFEPGSPVKPSGQSAAAATEVAPIRSAVEEGSASGGMTLRKLEFETGLTPSPIIELTASTPGRTLQDSDDWLPKLVGQGIFSLEGWFVVIYDGEGVPFYLSAVANRAGGGSSWVRPDLAGSYQSGSSGVFIDPASDTAQSG